MPPAAILLVRALSRPRFTHGERSHTHTGDETKGALHDIPFHRIGAPTVRSRHAVLASLTVGLMALTACSSGSGTDGAATQAGSTGGANGPVTLTLATFNQFGYEELIPEFEKSHPNIKVTHKKAATSNEARDNFFTRLSAGSGMADVEAVEVDWLRRCSSTPTSSTT